MSEKDTQIVVDHGQSKLSDLWTKEDYWAIWLGFAVLLVGIYIFIVSAPTSFKQTIETSKEIIAVEKAKAPFETLALLAAKDAIKNTKGTSLSFGKSMAGFLASPGKWKNNPMAAFYVSQASVDQTNAANKPKLDAAKEKSAMALETAKTAEMAAAAAEYKDEALNKTAVMSIEQYTDAKAAAGKLKPLKAKNLFTSLPILMISFMIFFGIGIQFMGQNLPKFAIGFIGIFIVSCLAFLLGSQSTMKFYGVGKEAWAIILGMLIANTVGTPSVIKPAVQVEFYIKTGLVLLGAGILFEKIIAIGIPGIFVAWVVTPTVLIATFIFGQKILKISSPTLNIVISADMSVCGTSAAIATAAACRAKKEELTLALGLSLAFTALMMIVMPMFITAVGMPPVLAGAWIGGTIDATGAVAAAGAVLGEDAMYVAATIKMIQNVLIGVTAFAVAVYWCTSVDVTAGRTVSTMEIWHRFPKFVLGFLVASVVFSLYSASLGPEMSTAVIANGVLKLAGPLRGWFFVLAFTAIGLATNFRELTPYLKGGKPLILYVCGQSFNLVLTFLMAYLMFYVLFPEITESITSKV